MAGSGVLELCQVAAEDELDGPNRTVAVFGNLDFCNILFEGVFFVHLRPVNEHDNVGVLLERAGFAQVRELRLFVGALLHGSRKLGGCQDGHVELASQDFMLREMADTS
jgi:hypothetical protein